MYNLANLNDYEFEILCKDIMESKLSIQLHRFAKGQDGGIDLCDSKENIQYMLQVKHYVKSNFSNLKNTLKNELSKVEKVNPSNYYICCSIELSPQQRKELFNLFSNYMKDTSYIIDKTDIDDFLSKEENKKIVEKNYKLWLCSTNVLSMIQNQHIFIDCSEILSDIEKYTKLFVTTKAYFECRNKLIEKNIIIIIGTPGVGKSTISKMLLLFFASNNYSVRYVTDNNIKDIKNILSRDPAKKEIILLDDFLGQHYLKLSDKQPNELKSLIAFIEKNPNKKIILNSRITIINEAYYSSIDFANLFDTYEKDNYLIDLDKMSYLEKAQILYNHLYFNDLPADFLSEIKKNKNYILIAKHKNYNPRIIEFVTKKKNYSGILSNEYVDYIIEKLNNPDSVWEDEFRNRLEEHDRVLMNTLYSLTNDKVKIDVLEKAFNKRILSITNNTTLNIFYEVIKRLNNSLIKIIIDRKKRYVSVINPSVNDFLNKKICNNLNEQITIINNAEYIEQLIKFKRNKKQIREFIFNNSIEKLNSIDKSTAYRYFELLIDYEIKDLDIKQFVQKMFKDLCDDYHYGKDDLIIELIQKGYVEFYELKEIIFQNLKSTLNNFVYDNIVILFKWIESQEIKLNDSEMTIIKESFANAIQDLISDSLNDDIQEIVSFDITSLNYNIEMPEGGIKKDLKDLYVDEYYDDIRDDIKQEINARLENIINNLPLDFDINQIDYDYILYDVDIDGAIKSFVDSKYDEIQIESYIENESFEIEDNEWTKIDEIFQ